MGLDALFRPQSARRRRIARHLYDQIMAAALSPELYRQGLAQDTLDGRFEQVALHASLVMRRLRDEDEPGRALAAGLQREVFSGFDYGLRETGVGDSTISRKVRALGERFYGLARGLDAAIGSDAPNAMIDLIRRNGLAPDAEARLAEYLKSADQHLGDLDGETILSGQVDWPGL